MSQKFTAVLSQPDRFTATLQNGPPGPVGPQGPPGPSLEHTGHVTANGELLGPLLTGWTATHPAVGEFHIVHNLHRDPSTYTVLLTSARDLDPLQVRNPIVLPPPGYGLVLHVGDQTEDEFVVYAAEGKDLLPFDAGFHFVLFPAAITVAAVTAEDILERLERDAELRERLKRLLS